MPLPRYGVLAGRVTDARHATRDSKHYQLRLDAGGRPFRASVNVCSSEPPSELLYLVRHQFEHPLVDHLARLAPGYHEVGHRHPERERHGGGRHAPPPSPLALDYIRGNLLHFGEMRPLPYDEPGPDNDLNELLDRYARKAMRDTAARAFVYGEPWLHERHADRVFGFEPGNGLHNVHMNQGNSPRFRGDDAPWQDGGLLFHFPSEDQWVAVFLKFQSQAEHTDDATGHALPRFARDPGRSVREERRHGPRPQRGRPTRRPRIEPEAAPDFTVQIVAALVNPDGPDDPEVRAGREAVTLLNRTGRSLDLAGWAITDAEKRRFPLSGRIGAGRARRVVLGPPVRLGNAGGLITLVDPEGVKVHGVAYTAEQAARAGETLVFGA